MLQFTFTRCVLFQDVAGYAADRVPCPSYTLLRERPITALAIKNRAFLATEGVFSIPRGESIKSSAGKKWANDKKFSKYFHFYLVHPIQFRWVKEYVIKGGEGTKWAKGGGITHAWKPSRKALLPIVAPPCHGPGLSLSRHGLRVASGIPAASSVHGCLAPPFDFESKWIGFRAASLASEACSGFVFFGETKEIALNPATRWLRASNSERNFTD